MPRENKGTALENLTYGIHVVTTRSGDIIAGFTACWVSQVSFNPSRLLVAVKTDSYGHKIIRDGGIFAVNILGSGQADLARKFSAGVHETRETFSAFASSAKKTGAPILKDALAFIECNVVSASEPGDHTLFVGEIVGSGVPGQGDPLTTVTSDLYYHPGEE
jgi:flavin reductase (DIM6/NTAB) family NADH-FMN oxidoreductase RutF